MKMRPLFGRVIVKRVEGEKTTASGIVIADVAVEKPHYGDIVAVGEWGIGANGELRPMQVRIGDRVLFGKYSGQEFKFDGQDLLTMQESDIISVLEV